MKRHFEYKDQKSSKFWEIELNGNAYTTTFGKIGTAGRSDTNSFESADKAQKEYDKIIAEKVKKGYKEVGDTSEAEVETAPNIPAEQLETYNNLKEKIAKTNRKFVAIELSNDDKMDVTTSKVGSGFYFPKGFEYPKNKDNKSLIPLAQINFSEVPALEGYPAKGILQFYIGSDDLHGLDFKNQQSQENFRTVYFENVDINNHQNIEVTFDGDVYTPHQYKTDLKMNFKLAEAPMSYNDFRFSKELPGVLDADDDFVDVYAEEIADAAGHKIGGYPFFTQEDPREYKKAFKIYELLFQLDTDDKFKIMWGDAGVGNFFIDPSDLAKLDFSKVIYNWDCC